MIKCQWYDKQRGCERVATHRVYVDGIYMGRTCQQHSKAMATKFGNCLIEKIKQPIAV